MSAAFVFPVSVDCGIIMEVGIPLDISDEQPLKVKWNCQLGRSTGSARGAIADSRTEARGHRWTRFLSWATKLTYPLHNECDDVVRLWAQGQNSEILQKCPFTVGFEPSLEKCSWVAVLPGRVDRTTIKTVLSSRNSKSFECHSNFFEGRKSNKPFYRKDAGETSRNPMARPPQWPNSRFAPPLGTVWSSILWYSITVVVLHVRRYENI